MLNYEEARITLQILHHCLALDKAKWLDPHSSQTTLSHNGARAFRCTMSLRPKQSIKIVGANIPLSLSGQMYTTSKLPAGGVRSVLTVIEQYANAQIIAYGQHANIPDGWTRTATRLGVNMEIMINRAPDEQPPFITFGNVLELLHLIRSKYQEGGQWFDVWGEIDFGQGGQKLDVGHVHLFASTLAATNSTKFGISTS